MALAADRIRLQQVLINLLYSAIKYNKPAGTVTLEVAITPANAMHISVRDIGEGLSPQQIAQLYQAFNRLGKEAGPELGTGIGLVVVKRLMKLMGCSVGVDSDVGVGSAFWIELNLMTAPLPAMNEADRPVPAHLPPPNGAARRTVLCLISAADGNLGVE